MKLSSLNVGDSACIKSISGDNDLSIHLMEMGLVKNTKIKVVKTINNKELIVIKYRGEVMSITLDIAHIIEVYDSSNR